MKNTSNIKFDKMLSFLRKEKGWTMEELGEKMNKTKSAISRWESGDNSPKVEDIEKLSKLFDIDIQNLIFGTKTEELIGFNNDTEEYPFYDVGIAAGALAEVGTYLEDDYETISISNSVMGKYANSDDIFITYINGDSMNNIIPDESLIAVKQLNSAFDLENGDIVVFRNGAGLSVKRFYNDKQERRLVFRPDSSYNHFTDMVISYDDVEDLQIYGKVVVYVVNL